MHALGIETGADLRGQTLAFLQERFGKAGSWYFEIARGRDDRPVQPDRERKSSGSETTFPEERLHAHYRYGARARYLAVERLFRRDCLRRFTSKAVMSSS
jgi:nucleotidyltransferase/DNA polymerase involved in DNA repair